MGAGGGSNKAAQQAAQQEGLRQANINRSMQQINQIYGSPQREADINDFLSASRSFYRQNLDRQHDAADRSLRFAMARNGLTGGSASVDANRQLGQDYQQGILTADRLAQSAANELRNADETSRMNMIQLAQTGADMTTGANNAALSLRNNLAGARSQLNADALGELFSGVGTIAKASRDQAETRRANRDFYNLYYSPGFGYGAGGR
ncbi:hypothetical protein [Stenotrophomonas acidaminiphila]|jgi:hypothetical protein|uniref:hypothetical protein n=1 Tax=Stenotrophomonas acidaminiphila TaxID=128780 RepID=UPI0028A9BE4D|nr:hypothetical protein [Stenotrophomonas acidaminiphila]